MAVRHPAKYSDQLLPVIAEMLSGSDLILDPFGGTGEKLHGIRPDAICLDLEPEWARVGCDLVGNALHLPFADGTFDAVATSPVYGNRMSDSFIDGQPDKKYDRNTYTHKLGRKLHPMNSGAMNWGEKYRQFHWWAWKEVKRVVKPDGIFVLNIKDHYRKFKRIYATDWHIEALETIGFIEVSRRDIACTGNRQGQNGDARIEYESVIKLHRP